MSARRDGFSLIELMAVVVLVTLVFFVAVDFYRQLTSQAALAADRTRNARHAVAVLDRVARDLEASVLVKKPEGADPLSHPWLFLGEGDAGASGSDRLKFVTRSPGPRTQDGADADVSLVAWLTAPSGDGTLELRRWSSPRLPESLDRDFPPADESLVVARGLASFGVRFLNEDGEWKERWDSSQLADADALPLAAEIEVALLPTGTAAPSDAAAGAEAELFTRRVLLPVRPLDLKELITGKASAERAKDEDGDGKPDETASDDHEKQGCVSVRECLARNPQALEAATGLGLQDVLDAVGDQCFSTIAGSLPPELMLQGCE